MGMYLYIKKRGPHYLRIIVVTMIAAVLLTGLGII
jgi:PTS system mannose-specific IID component/D-glucosaminate-specific PTS system IID component